MRRKTQRAAVIGSYPVVVVDLDLVPGTVADTAGYTPGHVTGAVADAPGEAHVAGHHLQSDEVVLLVVASIVQQEAIAGAGGEPGVHGAGVRSGEVVGVLEHGAGGISHASCV